MNSRATKQTRCLPFMPPSGGFLVHDIALNPECNTPPLRMSDFFTKSLPWDDEGMCYPFDCMS